jgi:hypothetical protein
MGEASPCVCSRSHCERAHANCFTSPVQTRTEVVRGPGNNTAQNRLGFDLQVERDDTLADAGLTLENAERQLLGRVLEPVGVGG